MSETRKVKKLKQHRKQQLKEKRITKWKSTPMHEQIANEVAKATINHCNTWTWLTHANLKTEVLITPCQDQVIATNYMKSKIMKTGIDQNCRLYRSFIETIHHIVSGSPIL